MNKFEKTYCNPIPLPDYPIGRSCVLGTCNVRTDYRETADPTVIYEDGVWYLYPSCGMMYYTEDFINWHHEKLDTYDIGYAPTVIKHKGRFLLLACSSELYVSDSPKGPFKCIGALKTPTGEELYVDDPMLFSDDDERLYLYCGCGGAIKGAELCSDCPTQLITPLSTLFEYNTVENEWERMGDWNEDGSYSWTEGAWMHKRGDTYYLVYSAGGTEWVSYSMGAYKSKSPLGPFEYMKSSPFVRKTHGLVRGAGHGSLVKGPKDTLWVFYTCCVCYGGNFERRIGFDAVGFDENGDFLPVNVTEIPQWAPGVKDDPHVDNNAGLVPVTGHRFCSASSNAPGRDPIYAIEDSMLSWWQPADEDEMGTLTVHIGEGWLDLYAARIIWRDVGLNVKDGVMPGPFGYKIEALDEKGEWICVLDKSENKVDLAVDYSPIKHIRSNDVRLVITSHPKGIRPGVINFTVFGKWEH